ncbi:type I-F CRISPR-associated protein Csy1 [Parendozoicomonas sp. Alg238-R29]|uniref:type I-F CRISPR-associated protein Csy1 n=1 Tax=Parendozoicomonas sp. Alg238-R29 TaxID=2993446 RepID=UPI00248D671F|nr:type I-F CRISPR-associated protein Csy1 [Parendozoicomonas sp. Alg238-R29]
MPDPAVASFFKERKDGWLKKNIKPAMDDGQVNEIHRECERQFSLEEWLPKAARRAGQISISTHPCTFTHPGAKKNKNGDSTTIIARAESRSDGFLRSGNVQVQDDALGNAAALDVYKFLSLVLEDGRPLLKHLEENTELAKEQLSIQSESYTELRNGFLAMTETGSENITSSKIKQVYFPVDSDYHLLSLLTPSGIVFDLRKRLDTLRFGDEVKRARDAKRSNEHYQQGYREIYGLTTLGYGGTKPQNISVLNNQNSGKAHLLLSAPPVLKQRTMHFPKHDFFSQSVRYHDCRELFQNLHTLYQKDDNNVRVRAARDEFYLGALDYIVERMWQLKDVASEQYNPEYHHLPKSQKIWLLGDEEHEQIRKSSDDWLEDIQASTVTFIFHGYEKILGKKAIKLGDAEHRHMKNLIQQHREVLR